MRGPACVVVIDDKGVNAKRLSAAWRSPSGPTEEAIRSFFDDSRQWWLYATDKLRNDPASAEPDLKFFGSSYSDGAVLVESMEQCAGKLEEIGSKFLEDGLLVYLDVQLDDICTNAEVCLNSNVVAQLREWVANGRRVFVHVHSTDHSSGKVAKAIDDRLIHTSRPGETNVSYSMGLGTADGRPEDTSMVMALVEASMDAWKRRFPGGIGDYLWTSRTVDWFKDNDPASPVTHDFHVAPAENRTCIEGLLSTMLGEVMVHRLLRDDEGVECLHSALKHLVGTRSVAQGGGGRNCNLGAAALLLLSACPGRDAAKEDLIQWEKCRHLDMPEVLSEAQTREEAKVAIARLYAMFRSIAVRKGTNNASTLCDLDLERTAVRAYFDLGEDHVGGALRALEEREEVQGGSFVGSVREFLAAARVARGQMDQRCVVNFYRARDAANELVLELRPCHSERKWEG